MNKQETAIHTSPAGKLTTLELIEALFNRIAPKHGVLLSYRAASKMVKDLIGEISHAIQSGKCIEFRGCLSGEPVIREESAVYDFRRNKSIKFPRRRAYRLRTSRSIKFTGRGWDDAPTVSEN